MKNKKNKKGKKKEFKVIMKDFNQTVGTIVVGCLIVSFIGIGVFKIDVQPAFIILRNVAIAALGGDPPKLKYDADNKDPGYFCNEKECKRVK